MKKVGIIRCQQTEDMCPGTVDFKFSALGKRRFCRNRPGEIVGFVSAAAAPEKGFAAR